MRYFNPPLVIVKLIESLKGASKIAKLKKKMGHKKHLKMLSNNFEIIKLDWFNLEAL